MTSDTRARSAHIRQLRYSARRAALTAAGTLPSFVRRNPRGVAIVYYHCIDEDRRRGVPPSEFDKQMQYLSSRFEVVRLGDLRSSYSAHDRPTACVTFDDGYLDNYELAAPILEHHGIKASFFMISSVLDGKFGEVRMMGARHLRELRQAGHEIGSHTATHPRLSRVDIETARRDIDQGRRALEDALGEGVTSFAYPYGDHNEAVKGLVREAGFDVAVTTRQRFVTKPTDWLTVPRIPVESVGGIAAFRGSLSPALDLVERMAGR